MDLPWILFFISILLIAVIAWHSSKFSPIEFIKNRLAKRAPEPFFPEYDENPQQDLFAEQDPLDELPNPPRIQNHILCIHLKASEGNLFGGEQLVIQLNRAGLRFGEFNIFHFEKLFSCASAYEPGVFDLDRMDTFQTAGLSFFMETAHLTEVKEAFDTMLEAAQYLAEQLRGELCDDQWKPLSESSLERYYEKIHA